MNQSSYFAAVDTKSPPAQFRIRLMAQDGDHSKVGCISRESSNSGHTETSASTPPPEGDRPGRKTPAQPSEEKAVDQILATTRIEISKITDTPTRTRLDGRTTRRQQPKSSHPAESQTAQKTHASHPKNTEPLSSAGKPSLLSGTAAAPSHAAPIHSISTQEVRTNIGSTSPPTAWSPSFLTAAPSDLLRQYSDDQEEILSGQEENLSQGRQLRFDPIVRIIPNPDEENSSDEEHPARRNRSHPRKRPVRLCTKKIALPFNISTSSLIGIGYQSNHSNASLTHINSSGAVSSRELYAQTRKEIDEDEQFIPDAPRFLSLTLPSITRQPDRRALRLEEEHRLERWRQMGGGDKSNLKPINFHNLSHLSPALRDRLNNSTIPVQLSTNTAINSIPCSISPEDVLDKLDTHTIMPSKEPVSVNQDDQLEILDTPHTLTSSTSIASPLDNIPNSSADHPSSSEVGVPSSLKLHALKNTRLGWLSDKVKSIRRRTDSQDPIKVPYLPIVDSTSDLPGTLLQKSPTPAWFNRPSAHKPPDPSLEGAPLKRVSTPRGLMSDTTTAGAPLHRTATPATSIRKPTGTPLEQSCNVGAPLIKMPTPGAALQRSGTSGAPLSKPRNVPFLKKLAIWRKKPPPSSSINSAPGFVNDPNYDLSNTSHPDPLGRSTDNGSNNSLVPETDGNNMSTNTTDKWGSRKEVPLRECCKVCLNSANVNVSQSPDTRFSTGALKQHYSKNCILQDTLRQGGIPSQQIKLISAELGAPYSSWVSQISTLNPGQNKLSQ
ncbi:hypothetical protein PCANC_05832 [Puccinia coronata f. sp. avenae]|uniref:Uncharacterized protein n=1 Tax=Puccinia coronata f. sp. avenae TaxID=200324 RepID=A0A2N5VSY7_9BASI|nr:hypothetical protein PCANC_05832 [Puccinia coronata f. sp. avenae]